MTYNEEQNEERRISSISESCVDSDMVASETKLAVAELLKKRLLPRTTYDLYVESDRNVGTSNQSTPFTFRDRNAILASLFIRDTMP